VAKKEFYRYGKADDKCLFCGNKDSIDHTFINCQFVRTFVNNVSDLFNNTRSQTFSLFFFKLQEKEKKVKLHVKNEEKLFGIISGPIKIY